MSNMIIIGALFYSIGLIIFGIYLSVFCEESIMKSVGRIVEAKIQPVFNLQSKKIDLIHDDLCVFINRQKAIDNYLPCIRTDINTAIKKIDSLHELVQENKNIPKETTPTKRKYVWKRRPGRPRKSVEPQFQDSIATVVTITPDIKE